MSTATAAPRNAVSPYTVEAFRMQVGLRHMNLGRAIHDAGYTAPGFRDRSLAEIVEVVDAAFPGKGLRCCHCHRRTTDTQLLANDDIACADCSAGVA